jgi:hypothetical protein
MLPCDSINVTLLKQSHSEGYNHVVRVLLSLLKKEVHLCIFKRLHHQDAVHTSQPQFKNHFIVFVPSGFLKRVVLAFIVFPMHAT